MATHDAPTYHRARGRAALAGGLLAGLLALGSGAASVRATQAPGPHLPHHVAPQAMVVTSGTPAASLRTALNILLQEHAYLAGAATGAALGGRDAEFRAAAAALDANSVALAQAIGSVYGPNAEAAFLPLWRAHIGMFVDYTQAVAMGDQAKKAKAVADLDGYRRDFDAFLSGANPNLPRGAVAELLTPHVMQLAAVVDAQAAGDPTRAYALLREAAGHMQHMPTPWPRPSSRSSRSGSRPRCG